MQINPWSLGLIHRDGLSPSFPSRYVEILTLGPVGVALFGNWDCADVTE